MPAAARAESVRPDVGIGHSGARACGNGLTLRIKVEPESQTIRELTVEAFGDARSAAANASIVALFSGRSLEQALATGHRQIADALGGATTKRSYCSLLVHEALRAAVADYRGERDVESDDSQMTCRCYAVRQGMLRRAILLNQLASMDEVIDFTRAASACGECASAVRDIVSRERPETCPPPSTARIISHAK